MNKNKTTIVFNKSAKEETKEMIKGVLGVQEIKHYEKYLGLPLLVGREKMASFNYIKERVWKKL